MGQAIMGGWLAQGLAPSHIRAIDPGDAAQKACDAVGVSCLDSIDDLDTEFQPDAVMFAVKPQMIAEAAPSFVRFATNALLVSIVAGTTITWFEEVFGVEASVLRVMPNTPALVQSGITALFANSAASTQQRDMGQSMFEAVGETVWLENEDHLDAVTAVSGSGPAYIFLLMEVMARAGREVGLPEETANKLARKTVEGAALLASQSDLDPASLRKNVTSPGGTTAAALEVLMGEPGMEELFKRAIKAATERGRELGQSS